MSPIFNTPSICPQCGCKLVDAQKGGDWTICLVCQALLVAGIDLCWRSKGLPYRGSEERVLQAVKRMGESLWEARALLRDRGSAVTG